MWREKNGGYTIYWYRAKKERAKKKVERHSQSFASIFKNNTWEVYNIRHNFNVISQKSEMSREPHIWTAFCCHIAYFWVHSFAVRKYFCLSVLYMRATSGTSGSSGLGSFNNEQIERRTSVEIIVKVSTF